jgi:hypothetical protein
MVNEDLFDGPYFLSCKELIMGKLKEGFGIFSFVKKSETDYDLYDIVFNTKT